MVAHLAKELGLSATQQDSVRAVLERHRAEMDTLWHLVHPRVDSLRATIHREINAQLTPAHRAATATLSHASSSNAVGPIARVRSTGSMRQSLTTATLALAALVPVAAVQQVQQVRQVRQLTLAEAVQRALEVQPAVVEARGTVSNAG